jgi:hypothetical protein
MAQWVLLLDLTTHTSLSSIRRGFASGFVNYKNSALDAQPQVIKFTSCLPISNQIASDSDFERHISNTFKLSNITIDWLIVGVLMPLSTIFQLYHAISWWRKPETLQSAILTSLLPWWAFPCKTVNSREYSKLRLPDINILSVSCKIFKKFRIK